MRGVCHPWWAFPLRTTTFGGLGLLCAACNAGFAVDIHFALAGLTAFCRVLLGAFTARVLQQELRQGPG